MFWVRIQGDFSALTCSAPTQSWKCYGPSGKAGTTQLSFIHFTDASFRVLLSLPDQHCRCCHSRAWLTQGYYDSNHGLAVALSGSLRPKWTSSASSFILVVQKRRKGYVALYACSPDDISLNVPASLFA